MKHVSLFSGIGGFDLAADWMGWENIAHCEKDVFCRRILNYYWPNANAHDDIITTDFSQYRGSVDIVSGGFPCQPYSVSGHQRGTEDPRHLWPQMLRAIREMSPRWVVGENVRGLIAWNGGMVFDQVQSDLEAEGYEVLPFVLPAASVGAWHERQRVWFVAHSLRGGWVQGHKGPTASELTQHLQDWTWGSSQPPTLSGVHGLSGELDGITIPRHRSESIKAAGNAIAPPVAYQIFKAIQAYQNL